MTGQICDLRGRSAVVTGAAQGIGLAITDALRDAGAKVVAVDMQAEGLAQLTATRPDVVAVTGDVTDPGLTDMLDAALDGGHPDILINNAGVARGAHALETSDEDLQRYFDINVLSVFRLSRWAAGLMAKAGGGAIVNTASIFGQIGAQNSAGYSTSKAAVIGMTRQMANDFGPSGIRINAVAPGLIETPLTAERIRTEVWRRQVMIEQAPLRRPGTAEDVAKVVRFLASDEASFITGQILAVDGGWAMGRYPRQEPINA
ncbi:SDR family NAD(P)-dependent oxidoreductase [Paracoccus xiamenensis]|uniref:SDR family NAD(P)-dependent oxidoreductase n=1 Tax=Paracoccus xiamenensis TaxID=2714901 RepID=UPI00140CC53A|nr:SDR family oxidoreductase [Paracoccus xiamenensis]NHF74452.1 SDR family oxidoreductase [Paracoccus xiamenensis]